MWTSLLRLPDTVYEDQRSIEEDREKLTTGICTAAKKKRRSNHSVPESA